MTYVIPDDFNDRTGAFEIWDTTIDHNSDKTFLTTNQHVDLRNFRSQLLTRPVLEQELEAEFEQSMENVVEQFLESNSTPIQENWVLTGTGLNAITIGPNTSRNGWGALKTTTNGSAVSATLTSSAGDQVDISAMDKISVVFPDYNSFDTATSYIQFCSNPSGDFSTNNSTQVHFSSNSAAMPELRLNVSAFANSGFDNKIISGVRIVLVKAVAPAAAQAVSVMALRALKSTWTYRQMDFDTRLGALVMPVTLSGGAPAGGTGTIPLIRGQQDKNDPIPEDLAMNLYFASGGFGGYHASGGNYNKVELYWRELKDVPDGTGSYIVTRLKWNAGGSVFEALRYDYASSTLTPTSAYTESIATLTPETRYLMTISFLGTHLEGRLYEVDVNGGIISLVWKSAGTSNPNFTYRNGRVGIGYDFQYDRDAFLDKFEAGVTNYAELETVAYNQRSVVDGVRLAASFSGDMNLWQSFSGSDLYLDQTKTISGQGSFRASLALQSNEFIVEDWNNTYLNFALWVPSGITAENSPLVQFISTATGVATNLILPTLQPAQWNRINLELSVLKGLLTGVGYAWQIVPATGSQTLGYIWVDSPMVGRRRVSFGVRAQAGAPYREFRSLINSATGAVHFVHNERGTQLELRIDALTSDAWVSQFSMIPHIAPLGNPIYDAAYQTR